MNGQELLVGLWRAVEAAGGKPSINGVALAARACGLHMRRADVYRILTPFRDSGVPEPEHIFTHAGTLTEQVGNGPHAPGAKVSVPKLGLFTDVKSTDAPTKPRKTSDVWTVPLLADVTALNARELRTLTSRELFTLARGHALLFAGCTVTEATNKSRASPIATGITYLLETLKRRNLGDFRVDEYLAAGRNVSKRRGGTPWYKPTLILAEITDGTSPPPQNGATHAKTETLPSTPAAVGGQSIAGPGTDSPAPGGGRDPVVDRASDRRGERSSEALA